MNDAKSHILSRIRGAAGTRTTDAAAISAEANALLPDADAVRPAFENLSSREKFIERATSERLTATVDEVESWEEAVAAVRHYLQGNNLPLTLAMPPMARLTELYWGDVSFHHEIAPNELAAIGVADFGIAETGTLIFSSRPETPTLFNYLGLHHIVLVEAKNLLRYMENYWEIVRSHGNVHPRNINFITGTSGTADIEAKNTRGAHGPRFMHIVIIG